MPSIFLFQGFAIFFWAAENGGPVHVHVAKGRPAPRATKICERWREYFDGDLTFYK